MKDEEISIMMRSTSLSVSIKCEKCNVMPQSITSVALPGLALLAFTLTGGVANAACTATPPLGVQATNGSVCTTAGSNFSGIPSNQRVVNATGAGTVLNLTAPQVTITGSTFPGGGPLWAENQGTINIDGELIVNSVSTGSYTSGIASHSGATVNLGTLTIVTQNGNTIGGAGIVAETVGIAPSHITAKGPIKVTTLGAPGILAEGGSTIIIQDIDVTVGNNGNPNNNGVFATGSTSSGIGSFIHYANGSITSSGTAIRAVSGADIVSSGNTLATTSNDNAFGILADGIGSSVTMGGMANLQTIGAGSHGALARSGGQVSLDGGGKVSTSGQGAFGLVATGSGSMLTANNMIINTTGSASSGVVANDQAVLNVNNSIVTTSGSNAAGISVSSNGKIEAKNLKVETSGDNANGIEVINGGTVDVTGSNISVYGSSAAGIFLSGNIGDVQTVNFTNASLKSASGPAILVGKGDAELNITNSVVSGNGSLFNVGNSGDAKLKLDVTNSTLTGMATTGVGSSSDVFLNGNSIWNMSDSSNVTNIFNSNSSIVFSAHPNFSKLTVENNYIGSNGMISLNTFLGDDSSPSDLLIVKGNTSGTSNVKINNIGGQGAPTLGDGIKVIDISGVSDGGFKLLGDYVHQGAPAVVSGAYAYKLYQNSFSNPADGDWYLRSQLMPDTPSIPLYQPGVPVYEAYSHILLGLNHLPTLLERVGNRYWNNLGNTSVKGISTTTTNIAPNDAEQITESNGIWLRVENSHTRTEPHLSKTLSDYDYDLYKFQVGFDVRLMDNNAGQLIGGLTMHYAHSDADTFSIYDSATGGGEISTDGFGFGNTLTWYGDNGIYLDSQNQVTWFNSNMSIAGGKQSVKRGNDGFGYALSLEGGKRIAINPNWSLTPQTQLSYSNIDFDSFDDVFNARVSLNRADSFQGRLGLSLDYYNSWYQANGMVSRINSYGIANIYNEFLNGTEISVSDTVFKSSNDRLSGSLGLGVSYNWNNDKYSVYGEGSVNSSLTNFTNLGDSYSGIVGFRIKW